MLNMFAAHGLGKTNPLDSFKLPLSVANDFCRDSDRTNQLVMDVGAYRGVFTNAARAILGDRLGLVVAFDPFPANMASMAQQGLDGAPGVRLEQLAVTANSGEAYFSVHSSSYMEDGTSWGGRVVTEKSSTDETLRVDCVSLGEYLDSQGLSTPLLVKIDVQGGEWDVVTGLADRITEVPFLYFECQLKDTRDLWWGDESRNMGFEVLMDGFQFGLAGGHTERELARSCDEMGLRITRRYSDNVWYAESTDGDRFLRHLSDGNRNSEVFSYFQTDLFAVNARFDRAMTSTYQYLLGG